MTDRVKAAPAGEPEVWVDEGYQYWRQKYADGRIETYRAKAVTGQPLGEWEKLPDKLDRDLADLHKLDQGARTSASADASVNAPPTQRQIVTRRPDGSLVKEDNPNYAPPSETGKRIEAANATVAEANAAKATAGPPMINRGARPTPGTNAAVDDPRSMTADVVSKDQADYDRQAKQDLAAAVAAAEKKIHDDAVLAIQKGALDNAQVVAKANAAMDALRIEVQREQNAITKRGQDLAAETARRGQDITAGVTQRGQGMDYETAAGNAAGANWGRAMPFWNAPGQIESTNSLMAGGPPVATRPGQLPFNPDTLFLQGALGARGIMPGQFQLPGGPAQVPRTDLRLPS